MKARYTALPDKRTKEVYNRKLQEMQSGFAVLYEKLLIFTLHTEFGYGHKRISDIIEQVAAKVDDMHNSPVFWDKVDEDVIDNLGFEYPRCDYEAMEKIFYKPPEVTAEEKRQAVGKMAKMKEFLESRNAAE